MSNKENKTTNNETLKQTEDMQTEDMQTENKDSLVKNLQEVRELVNELVSNNPEAQIEKWCKYDESNNMQEIVGKIIPKSFEQLSKENQEIVTSLTNALKDYFKELAKDYVPKQETEKKENKKYGTDAEACVQIITEDDKYKDAFLFDEFSGKRQIVRKVDWHSEKEEDYPIEFTKEADMSELYIDLEHRFKIKNYKKIDTACDNIFSKHKYNSFLEKLKKDKWDGKPHIEEYFIKHLGVEDDKDEVARQTALNFYLTGVARVFGESKSDMCILLVETKGGVGKSTAVKNLAYDNDYYLGEYTFNKDKQADNFLAIKGKLVAELPELSGVKNKEMENFKAILSLQRDEFRKIYAQDFSKQRRTAQFVITTNNDQIFPDLGGLRRFVPLECHADKIQEILLPSADGTKEEKEIYYRQQEERIQRWLEAYERYMRGERPKLGSDFEEKAAKLREKYIIEDCLAKPIFDYLKEKIDKNELKDQGNISASDIFLGMNKTHDISKFTNNVAKQMTKILSTFPFLNRYKTMGYWAYKFHKSNYDEHLAKLNEQENN